MAFVKKTWIDRVVQYANRRLLTKSGGEVEQVTVTRDEGTVSVAGDKFDAATMNDLENRIYNADTNMKAYIDTEKVANTASYLYQPTVTTPTLSVGTNHNDRTFYYKHGTRVCLSIGVRDLSVGLINQDIFFLPVGYRPRNSISVNICGYSFDKRSSMMITNAGLVRVAYTEDQGAFGYVEFDAYS